MLEFRKHIIFLPVIVVLAGCSYKNTALEPYEPVPASCEEIRSEMEAIAEKVGDTWFLRDIRDALQIGLNVAVAATWINPGFAAFNIALQGIPTKDQSKLIRLNFLGHAYEDRDCWDANTIADSGE